MNKLLEDLDPIKEISEINSKSGDYDSILDSFLIKNDSRVEVRLEGENPSDLKELLDLRIKARYLDDIVEISVVDDFLILEK
jgi:hypothetical protein